MIRRIIIIFFGIICYVKPTFAQVQKSVLDTVSSEKMTYEKNSYLLPKFSLKGKPFWAIQSDYGNVAGQLGVFLGTALTFRFPERIFFGIYGTMLASTNNNFGLRMLQSNGQVYEYANMAVDYTHTGFWLGYVFNPKSPIHLVAHTKIGYTAFSAKPVGEINIPLANGATQTLGRLNNQAIIFIPALDLESNLVPGFRLNLGVGYRFLHHLSEKYLTPSQTKEQIFSDKDFGGFLVNFGIQISSY